jgi:hypothetical protein
MDDKETRTNAVLGYIRDGMSLRAAAKAASVPASTFLDWCAADKDLAERYARARDSMIDAMADDLLTIADKPAQDAVEAQKHRLQVDTRKWLLSKLAPKRYGDRLEVAGDKEAPLQVGVRVEFVKP